MDKKSEKAEKPQINWKIAADRAAIGDKTELKSLPGLWVKPRKFTKQGAAEILAAQTRATMKTRAASNAVTKAVLQSGSDADSAGLTQEQKAEIATVVMQNASADMIGHLEEDEARILFGIAEHNFEGEPQAPTKEWVTDIMQYAEIADEILGIVQEKNRPLPG